MKCCNFKLLTLVSMSNFFLAYSIQCLSVFLVLCTNLNNYINVDQPGLDEADAAGLKSASKIIKEIDLNNDLRTYLQQSAFDKDAISYQCIGFIIGSFHLGMFVHALIQTNVRNQIQKQETKRMLENLGKSLLNKVKEEIEMGTLRAGLNGSFGGGEATSDSESAHSAISRPKVGNSGLK